MMPLGPGLPSPTTLIFNFPTRGIMSIINIVPISIDNNDEHHKTVVRRQIKMIRNIIFPEIILIFQ